MENQKYIWQVNTQLHTYRTESKAGIGTDKIRFKYIDINTDFDKRAHRLLLLCFLRTFCYSDFFFFSLGRGFSTNCRMCD